MCIIFIAHDLGPPCELQQQCSEDSQQKQQPEHVRYPLVLAANRDEWLHRAAEPMQFWSEPGCEHILAGMCREQMLTDRGVQRDCQRATSTQTSPRPLPIAR
jgi:Transport and Golgi organisation 2